MNRRRRQKFKESDLSFLRMLNTQKHVRPPMDKITEFIEGNRILPPGTPMPGVFSYDTTPYMREITDNMSPSSLVGHQTIMKGVQIGATTSVVENTIGYYIGEMPAEVLLISATDELLKEWMDIRAEPLIDSLNLRRLIFSQSGNTKSRKTGDTASKKQYPGGQLDLASARSAPKLRMKSKQVVLLDEVDGAPAELTTGEGSFVAVSEGRAVAYGHRAKIALLSTPTTYERSLIWKYYQDGDQRKYFMPCPCCGQPLPFEWEGFKWTLDGDGRIEDVWYDCPHCHGQIFNHNKTEMMAHGEWVPTATAISKTKRSYYLPAFYSPVGMLSWTTIVERFLKAQEDPTAMASWVNLYCGLPFKDVGTRPDIDYVHRNKGAYKRGTIQDGVLFLTMFVDVQEGSKRTDVTKPQRLEMEILGHGAGYRSWSVDYVVIEGGIHDAFSGAWESLYQMAMNGGFRYKRSDGRVFGLEICLIDSGSGGHYDTVYEFCGRWANTHPSKGFQDVTRLDRKNLGDVLTKDNFKRYKASKRPEGVVLYEISTNYYKRQLYKRLKLERIAGAIQKTGFCDFPTDYDMNYFKQLTAAELRSDGSFYDESRAHEALDCRVGNMCAGDVFLDAMVDDLKKRYRENGMDRYQVQEIDKNFVLEYLKTETIRIDKVRQ